MSSETRPTHDHQLLYSVASAMGAPMAYLEWPNGRCLWSTAAYATLLGIPTLELVGNEPQNYLSVSDWNEWRCAFEKVASPHSTCDSLQNPLPFDQHVLPCLLIAHRNASAQLQGVIVVPLQDLTGIDAMQMVQESDVRMHRYAHATSEALIFYRHGRIFDANPAAVALTGYPLSQLIDQPVIHLVPHALREQMHSFMAGTSYTAQETRLLHNNGQELDVELSISQMPENGDHYTLLVLRDITARKRAEAEVHFLANHDPLTRLPNRQGLMRLLRQVVSGAQQGHTPVAVLYIDMDRFKDVNDSLGHEAGDRLLIQASRRIRSKVHPDDIVARLGGDEFAVVLTSRLTASQADCILQEIHYALSKPYQIGDKVVNVTASIGICLFPDDGASADELMLNASAAMETAKTLGQGHRQFYTTRMAARPSRLLIQDQLLREAIQTDTGLVLHYQPIWNLQTNRLEGFEALVRWNHPERGLLPPGEFIGFAEARGLISMVDRWVMQAACKQLRAWADAGIPPVVVSVNMSAIEFSQTNLVEEVRQTLKSTGINPQQLEIELTETTLMHESERVLATLEALRDLGVRLSIDDFGTGYSSLAYLKRYPLDKIKIDRSFVKDTPDDADDVSLIKAIVQMAHSLSLRTVAEGVETQAQQDLLKSLGCGLIQGYYLSRPMPATEALTWLQQRLSAPETQPASV